MLNDTACLEALRRFGLLKYERLDLMKIQEDILRWIIQQLDE